MRKILITGNGFDLYHGLPTKYGHFMTVMKTIEKYDFGKEANFEDVFGRYFKEEYSQDYELMLKNFKTEEITFDKARIKELEEKLKTNNWYNYFKKALEIETWIDFENEINIALSEVVELFNADVFYDVTLKNCLKHSLLVFFNITEENPNSYQINEKYKKIVKNVTGISLSEKINQKKVFEELSLSLNEFTIIFNRYFIDIINKFYENIKSSLLIPFRKVDEIYTFNYTPTVEKLYNINPSKVVYLHGKIDANDFFQNLILGVNEISDNLKTHKLFNFTKYYQKIKKRSNSKFIEVPGTTTNSVYPVTFYIIGHSLDASDKLYIEDLFSYLKEDLRKTSKICVFYYDDKDYESKLRNIHSIIDNKVLSLRNKEERFYFLELNKENLNKEFSDAGTGLLLVEPSVF